MARKAKTPQLPKVLPRSLPIANVEIVPQQLFRVPERHPPGAGPWQGEYDKIGWIDAATDLRCIILRQENGTLSGYVGVKTGHPLFGIAADALPHAFLPPVHGELTYASACEANVSEAVSVCHLAPQKRVGTSDVSPDEEIWWLGFDTDHPFDLVPAYSDRSSGHTGRIYRDQGYVYRECMKLARGLDAIGENCGADLPPAFNKPVPLAGLKDA